MRRPRPPRGCRAIGKKIEVHNGRNLSSQSKSAETSRNVLQVEINEQESWCEAVVI
jgi:hypothetical protein